MVVCSYSHTVLYAPWLFSPTCQPTYALAHPPIHPRTPLPPLRLTWSPDHPNTQNSHVFYRLEGPNSDRFNIDFNTGIVTVARRECICHMCVRQVISSWCYTHVRVFIFRWAFAVICSAVWAMLSWQQCNVWFAPTALLYPAPPLPTHHYDSLYALYNNIQDKQ